MAWAMHRYGQSNEDDSESGRHTGCAKIARWISFSLLEMMATFVTMETLWIVCIGMFPLLTVTEAVVLDPRALDSRRCSNKCRKG